MKIRIIGLGGIGSILCEKISRFVNQAGPCEIYLIDGDEFEEKNRSRQEFVNFGNKANVKMAELTRKFDNVTFYSIPTYINELTIKECIEEDDVIFLCVDNHKTRKLVSEYVDTLTNATLISGGNEYTDGNVQIYIRREGIKQTPSLTDYHPEIQDPDDKRPDEMSCEELSKSEPQLFFTNLGVSTIMCWAFYNIIVNDLSQIERPSEIYFDIKTMCSDAKFRKVN